MAGSINAQLDEMANVLRILVDRLNQMHELKETNSEVIEKKKKNKIAFEIFFFFLDP